VRWARRAFIVLPRQKTCIAIRVEQRRPACGLRDSGSDGGAQGALDGAPGTKDLERGGEPAFPERYIVWAQGPDGS
jgi:hypothetical protein